MKLKNVNLANINDTIFNSFSVSLLPPISTNKLLSFHTRNTISLNIIGGNSKGLNGVEIGGVYNYDDGDVYGVQVAGVVNAVSEDVVGTQISGVMNAVKGNVKGVQVAGVINNNDSITEGIQISGVYQKTHTLRGLQIGGLYNRAVKAIGGQISGLINTVDSATTFLQIAGLYNHAANIKGIQISGLVNTCDTLTGLQIGIFNRANHVKKGLSIGLINYVKNGYNKLEFSHNDLGTTYIGYRSGWAPCTCTISVASILSIKICDFFRQEWVSPVLFHCPIPYILKQMLIFVMLMVLMIFHRGILICTIN